MHVNPRLIPVLLVLFLSVLPVNNLCARDTLYQVGTESLTFTYPFEASGPPEAVVAYNLFYPADRTPGQRYPLVLLTHGFARTPASHAVQAWYLAQRGFVVATPQMVSLLGGVPAQLVNIGIHLDLIRKILSDDAQPGNPNRSMIDAQRIGMAGFSAGGGIAFEAAWESQFRPNPTAPVPVRALFLLDAVPYFRATFKAATFAPAIPILSLRAEPSPCNAFANVVAPLQQLPFPARDIRVLGASHCDGENPSDVFCGLVCGLSTTSRQAWFLELMHLFFRDQLAAEVIAGEEAGLDQRIAEGESEGALASRILGASLVDLEVNGKDPAGGIVSTNGPVRLTLDLAAGGESRELDWYFVVFTGNQTLYGGPNGFSTTPQVLIRAAPVNVSRLTLWDLALPPGGSVVFYFALADGSEIVSLDAIAATRP